MAQLHVSSWFAGKQQLLSRAMLGSVERETEKAVLFKGTALLQPSDICLRCGREITHPVSLHYGYGPDCAEHIGIPNAHLRDDADVVAGLAAAQAALVESRTVEFWVPKSQIEKLDYSTEEIEALEKGKLAAKEKVSIKVFDDIIRVDNLPYDDRHLARLAGCRWNGDDKYWWIEATPANAVQIANAFEGYGSIRINAAYRSLRAEGEFDVDNIDGLVTPLWSHQKDALRFLYDKPGGALCHDMGCGKSLTAIAMILARKHITTLVLCPKRVINTLADQVRMHAPDAIIPVPLAKGSVAKKTNLAKQAYEYARRTNTPTMIIINYESAWREPFATWSKSDDVKWDLLMMDECHRIKSPGGKQSRYAQAIGRKASYRLGMTGTPMPNNPLDIYAQYRAINDRIFGTRFAAFRYRYAEVTERFGFPLILGYRNQEELRDKFFSIAHMVHASDVLDLPDFQNINVPVELSATERKHYKEMEALLWTELGLDPNKIDQDEFWDNVIEGNESTATNPLVKNLRLQQITGGHIKDDEGVVSRFGDSKAKALKEILEDVGAVRENEHDRAVAKLFGQAESPEPVVVFALFHQDLEAIKKVCEEVGLRYGEISGRVNEDDYDAWKRGEVDVMAVQIASGGEGLNDLVRARICIYYSLGYSLKDFLQSRRRVLRPGQKNDVIYYYLAAEGTVDERVYAKLQAKQDTVEGLLGKKMG